MNASLQNAGAIIGTTLGTALLLLVMMQFIKHDDKDTTPSSPSSSTPLPLSSAAAPPATHPVPISSPISTPLRSFPSSDIPAVVPVDKDLDFPSNYVFSETYRHSPTITRLSVPDLDSPRPKNQSFWTTTRRGLRRHPAYTAPHPTASGGVGIPAMLRSSGYERPEDGFAQTSWMRLLLQLVVVSLAFSRVRTGSSVFASRVWGTASRVLR